MRKKVKRASSCYEIYKLLLCALPMLFLQSISAQDNITELIRGDSGISKHYTFSVPNNKSNLTGLLLTMLFGLTRTAGWY